VVIQSVVKILPTAR